MLQVYFIQLIILYYRYIKTARSDYIFNMTFIMHCKYGVMTN